MGRFSKLEFDGGDEGGSNGRHGPLEQPAADACFLQAEREYREGNFENALRLYSRALELDRLMIEAWRRQVMMLVELDQWREAALWADKAMELFPDDADLLAAKATSLCRLGDAGGALKVADRAIRLPGPNPYPWVARGEVLLFTREGHHEYCFNKAITAAPAGWPVLAQIARVYQFHGLYSKALEYFNKASAREPGIAFVMLQSAYCQKGLGMNQQARRMFEEVLRLNPRHVEAKRELQALDTPSLLAQVRGVFRRLKGK